MKIFKLHSLEDVQELIEDVEEAASIKFWSHYKDKEFGRDAKPHKNMRVRFEHKLDGGMKLPPCGHPFMVVGKQVKVCEVMKEAKKIKLKMDKQMVQEAVDPEVDANTIENTEHGIENSTEKQPHVEKVVTKQEVSDGPETRENGTSTEIGCNARITMTHVLQFSEFKIPEGENRAKCRREAAHKIKTNMDDMKYDHVFYVKVPDESEHSGHPTGATVGESVDPEVEAFIITKTKEGVRNSSAMQRHIDNFVTKELFKDKKEKPERWRRKYYPSKPGVASIMRQTRNNIERERMKKRHALNIKCTDTLQRVNDAIYSIRDEEYIRSLIGVLKTLEEEVASKVPKGAEIPKQITSKKRKFDINDAGNKKTVRSLLETSPEKLDENNQTVTRQKVFTAHSTPATVPRFAKGPEKLDENNQPVTPPKVFKAHSTPATVPRFATEWEIIVHYNPKKVP